MGEVCRQDKNRHTFYYITDRKMTTEILEKLTCPFSDVSETHWAYNDILLAACEY